jgi:hypothetical protein
MNFSLGCTCKTAIGTETMSWLISQTPENSSFYANFTKTNYLRLAARFEVLAHNKVRYTSTFQLSNGSLEVLDLICGQIP